MYWPIKVLLQHLHPHGGCHATAHTDISSLQTYTAIGSKLGPNLRLTTWQPPLPPEPQLKIFFNIMFTFQVFDHWANKQLENITLPLFLTFQRLNNQFIQKNTVDKSTLKTSTHGPYMCVCACIWLQLSIQHCIETLTGGDWWYHFSWRCVSVPDLTCFYLFESRVRLDCARTPKHYTVRSECWKVYYYEYFCWTFCFLSDYTFSLDTFLDIFFHQNVDFVVEQILVQFFGSNV